MHRKVVFSIRKHWFFQCDRISVCLIGIQWDTKHDGEITGMMVNFSGEISLKIAEGFRLGNYSNPSRGMVIVHTCTHLPMSCSKPILSNSNEYTKTIHPSAQSISYHQLQLYITCSSEWFSRVRFTTSTNISKPAK